MFISAIYWWRTLCTACMLCLCTACMLFRPISYSDYVRISASPFTSQIYFIFQRSMLLLAGKLLFFLNVAYFRVHGTSLQLLCILIFTFSKIYFGKCKYHHIEQLGCSCMAAKISHIQEKQKLASEKSHPCHMAVYLLRG